jgi:plastocyanin
MRRILFLASASLAAIVMLAAWQAAEPATAATNLNVHVHDDFYHPAGAFLVGPSTDHNLAQTSCQAANPAPACDAVITAGSTITWVSPAPLASHLHTVTECTDNTFSVCGPSVSPVNPIGDSGVRNPPNPGPSGWPYGPIVFTQPGTYYYRCEVHPATMRGRVVVQPNTAVGGAVELVSGGSVSGATWKAGLGAVALLVFASAGGVSIWRRKRENSPPNSVS